MCDVCMNVLYDGEGDDDSLTRMIRGRRDLKIVLKSTLKLSKSILFWFETSQLDFFVHDEKREVLRLEFCVCVYSENSDIHDQKLHPQKKIQNTTTHTPQLTYTHTHINNRRHIVISHSFVQQQIFKIAKIFRK